jgi:hypothetical protein
MKGMRDPWATSVCGHRCRILTADKRIDKVKLMNLADLGKLVEWHVEHPETQWSVIRAALRRIQKLQKTERNEK